MKIMEQLFMGIVGLSFLASSQMLLDLPGWDVPDVKDFRPLFPNHQPVDGDRPFTTTLIHPDEHWEW